MQAIYYYDYVRWVAIRRQPGCGVGCGVGSASPRTRRGRSGVHSLLQPIVVAPARAALGTALVSPVAK